MASTDKSPDRWELERNEMLTRLQNCQKEHKVHSCTACEKVLGCEIRMEYVKKVYESMSKGQGGGFEF